MIRDAIIVLAINLALGLALQGGLHFFFRWRMRQLGRKFNADINETRDEFLKEVATHTAVFEQAGVLIREEGPGRYLIEISGSEIREIKHTVH